jgi:hypothetical protein
MADKENKGLMPIGAILPKFIRERMLFLPAQSLIDETAAEDLIPLALEHTRCPRCHVWSRRPDRCPHCGAAKTSTVQVAPNDENAE